MCTCVAANRNELKRMRSTMLIPNSKRVRHLRGAQIYVDSVNDAVPHESKPLDFEAERESFRNRNGLRLLRRNRQPLNQLLKVQSNHSVQPRAVPSEPLQTLIAICITPITAL
jgi:hypothetical protein